MLFSRYVTRIKAVSYKKCFESSYNRCSQNSRLPLMCQGEKPGDLAENPTRLLPRGISFRCLTNTLLANPDSPRGTWDDTCDDIEKTPIHISIQANHSKTNS